MKTVPIQSKTLRFVIIVGFVLGTLGCGFGPDLFANQDDAKVVLSGKMTGTGFTESTEQAAAEITNEKQ